jgi:hypothetical protein
MLVLRAGVRARARGRAPGCGHSASVHPRSSGRRDRVVQRQGCGSSDVSWSHGEGVCGHSASVHPRSSGRRDRVVQQQGCGSSDVMVKVTSW